jgi:RNA polymerase subunit RPABC4/transcription elongation factor Spt4
MKKEKICPVCEKGRLIPVEDIVSEIEGYIFVEKGERCTSCGEEFISKSARGTVLRIPSDIEKT